MPARDRCDNGIIRLAPFSTVKSTMVMLTVICGAGVSRMEMCPVGVGDLEQAVGVELLHFGPGHGVVSTGAATDEVCPTRFRFVPAR